MAANFMSMIQVWNMMEKDGKGIASNIFPCRGDCLQGGPSDNQEEWVCSSQQNLDLHNLCNVRNLDKYG